MEARHHLHQPLGAKDALREGIEPRLDTNDGDNQQRVDVQFPTDGLRRRENGLHRLGGDLVAAGHVVHGTTQTRRQHLGGGIFLSLDHIDFVDQHFFGRPQFLDQGHVGADESALDADHSGNENHASSHQQFLENHHHQR
ncbi:hypothetical protein SDC9_197526 [bioreactor metagenome]|uniref:Uncharacterized protein n=1 Tax=bioreactor metagenome TaxID=1076179 RepID=A0A645IGD2_9ZZZZ